MITKVLSFPVGWISGAFVPGRIFHGSHLELIFEWMKLQGLSVLNCFLIGYGIAGIAGFIRRQLDINFGDDLLWKPEMPNEPVDTAARNPVVEPEPPAPTHHL